VAEGLGHGAQRSGFGRAAAKVHDAADPAHRLDYTDCLVFRYARRMMTELDVQKEIRKFIIENFLFGDEAAAPRPEQSLVESGLVDSTGVLDVAAFLDKHFGVIVEDDELVAENFDSIQSISRFVVRKTG
jgi:acyl carrier protein